jgi:hypothetical protein
MKGSPQLNAPRPPLFMLGAGICISDYDLPPSISGSTHAECVLRCRHLELKRFRAPKPHDQAESSQREAWIRQSTRPGRHFDVSSATAI